MIDYNTTYLDLINTVLDSCSTEYSKCFGIVTMHVVFQKPDKSKIEETLKTYSQTRLSSPLKKLIDFPIMPLRTEIFKNLAFFTRDNQEKYYSDLLLDLTYKLGVNSGELEFHQKTVRLISNQYIDEERYPEYFSVFQYDLESLQHIISNIREAIIPFNSTSRSQEIEQTESNVELQWKGDKTDLAELVWALAKSGRIINTLTGKDVTQKELAIQIATLLGIDTLDIPNLLKFRYGTKTQPTSYKAKDGKTFVKELQSLLDSRVLD